MPNPPNQRDPSEVMYRGVMGIGGLLLFLFGAGMSGWAIYSLITAGFAAGTLVTLGIMGVVAIVGLVMLRVSRSAKSDDNVNHDADLLEGSRQRGVLRTARKYEGRVTLAEISLETRLDVSEARQILDEFELHGIAELQISDGGQEVYVFPAFTDGGRDKLTARSPLDEDAEVELLFEQLAQEQAEQEQAEQEQAEQQAATVSAPATKKSDA